MKFRIKSQREKKKEKQNSFVKIPTYETNHSHLEHFIMIYSNLIEMKNEKIKNKKIIP